MSKTRVRFAPSPTGPLHIGGLRTALYNYLYAKSVGGEMILRIEDTDRSRYVDRAEDYIFEALDWSGIQLDEGPQARGILGPYRQSERVSIYQNYAKNLVKSGHAYYAFDTVEELETMRTEREAQGIHSPKYDWRIREEMNTSLNMTEEELATILNTDQPYVIRFKIPDEGEVTFSDEIRGEVTFDCSELDDKVLLKGDGWPTYHMANVVDDYLMQISHVIRGEEWLSSTGLHVLLYRALGWKKSIPLFAHLPLILKPTGKGKLSKRDGAKFGIPVFPLEWKDGETGDLFLGFRELGFDPAAVINFIALLGWNPGGEEEVFSMTELAELFSLDKVGKSGARFDFDKARWFNQQYVLNSSSAELAAQAMPFLKRAGYTPEEGYTVRVCELMRERIQIISELPEAAVFFFTEDFPMDEKQLKKRWKEDSGKILGEIHQLVLQMDDFSRSKIERDIKDFINEKSLKFGQVLPLLRLAVSGTMEGPDIFASMELIGKVKCEKRLAELLQKMN